MVSEIASQYYYKVISFHCKYSKLMLPTEPANSIALGQTHYQIWFVYSATACHTTFTTIVFTFTLKVNTLPGPAKTNPRSNHKK